MQLAQIADIRQGLTLRGPDAARSVPEGTHALIRIGDISPDAVLDTDADFARIKPDRVPDELLLRPGDVLFPARGTRVTPVVFGGTPAPAVVGPQFFILRPKPGKLLPEFLAWWLMLPASRAWFDAHRRGTYVQLIARPTLAEMDVPLPPLETQRHAAAVLDLQRRERQLATRLLDLQRAELETRLTQQLIHAEN